MYQKVLKTENDYSVAYRRASELVESDPLPGTQDADELELLTVLISEYESRSIHLDHPDPVSAIEFRMEEQGLRQVDLVPFLGSRSRVSEVLSGKRALTLQMIRALATGLQIPLTALVAEPKLSAPIPSVDVSKLPLREIVRRGWLGPFAKDSSTSDVADAVTAFLASASKSAQTSLAFRRTIGASAPTATVRASTLAWTARVTLKAREMKLNSAYHVDHLSMDSLSALAKLSWFEDGPLRAVGFLRDIGIRLVFEQPLSKSLVDGVALLLDSESPVIGMSLRFDRIDYFWFTLMHELVHVWRHLNVRGESFVDRNTEYETEDPIEKEANRIAQDALIPHMVWCRSEAFLKPSMVSIRKLAAELHIHEAIVTGRLHYESKNYSQFRNLLGQGTVKKQFIQSM